LSVSNGARKVPGIFLLSTSLSANKNCADKWRESSQHLENCDCLEQEAKKTYLLFSNPLKESKKKLQECECETSKKVRVDYLDSAGSG